MRLEMRLPVRSLLHEIIKRCSSFTLGLSPSFTFPPKITLEKERMGYNSVWDVCIGPACKWFISLLVTLYWPELDTEKCVFPCLQEEKKNECHVSIIFPVLNIKL